MTDSSLQDCIRFLTALHSMQDGLSRERCLPVCLSVRPSVRSSVRLSNALRVDCDKTEEKNVQIFIP